MFESVQTIHWLKKGPLAVVWTAANLDKWSDLRSRLNRNKCIRVDVSEACRMVVTAQVSMSIRLSSRLLLGITRIYQRQTHFALIDSECLKRRFDVLNAMSFEICQARPDQITYPEPDFNLSFTFVNDIHSRSSILQTSSPMAGFFIMDVEVDRGLINTDYPSSPLPRSGSIRGSPPADASLIADPKDISVEDTEAECNLLETSLMDSMYFGDEDPMLVKQVAKISPPKDTNQDLVLLFDDISNSFSFSDGGGPADISSPNIATPVYSAPQTQRPMVFESPFVDRTSHNRAAIPPHSSTNDSVFLKPESSNKTSEQCFQLDEYVKTNTKSMKKRTRRREKFSPVDVEISLSRHQMKADTSHNKMLTRVVDLRAVKFPKVHSPKDLLFQMYTEPESQLKLSKSLLQPTLTLEKATDAEMTISGNRKQLSPNANVHTPNFGQMCTPVCISDESVGHSELEVVRGGSQRDDLSYDDQFTNASGISGDSTLGSSRGHSFQFSTTLRLKEVEGKDTKYLPPLISGGLSPIIDIDEEMRDMSATSIGAMPSLDDSIECKLGLQTSSFMEHSPSRFGKHLMALLERREEILFKQLLPEGCTRKTAGRAFHNILTILSNSRQLQVEQCAPYGSIILRSGERHRPLSHLS